MNRSPVALWSLPLLLLAACPGSSQVYDDFDDTADLRWSGCADTYIGGVDADGTLGIFFKSDGQVEATQASGVTQTFTLGLGIDAELEVREGSNVAGTFCTDVVVQPVVISDRWLATAGTATLTIEPDLDAPDPYSVSAAATLTLSDVWIVHEETGEEVHLTGVGPVTATVGWYPG